jgi:hypothetical protein
MNIDGGEMAAAPILIALATDLQRHGEIFPLFS